jgi:hypothetical protein
VLTLGVLAVVGLVVAFSLSSTLIKRAESPGVAWRHLPARAADSTAPAPGARPAESVAA